MNLAVRVEEVADDPTQVWVLFDKEEWVRLVDVIEQCVAAASHID